MCESALTLIVILPHTAFKMFPYTYVFLPAAVPLLKAFLPLFSITPYLFACNNVNPRKSKRSLPLQHSSLMKIQFLYDVILSQLVINISDEPAASSSTVYADQSLTLTFTYDLTR
jgi:hypothetical protein